MSLLEQTAGLQEAMFHGLGSASRVTLCGRVVEARGTLIRVAGLDAKIGELCELRQGNKTLCLAEVTGLVNECALLMPHGELEGLSLGARVIPLGHGHRQRQGRGRLRPWLAEGRLCNRPHVRCQAGPCYQSHTGMTQWSDPAVCGSSFRE